MSRKATDAGVSASAIRRATVDFPEPEPPAMPMMSGFTARLGGGGSRVKSPGARRKGETQTTARLCVLGRARRAAAAGLVRPPPPAPATAALTALAAPQDARVDLVVAATTDVHGRLRGWDYYADTAEGARGLTRIATILAPLRGAP